MIINKFTCRNQCRDVNIIRHFSHIDINPDSIRLIIISEAVPGNLDDYFYRSENSSFLKTTNQAFMDAGYAFDSTDTYLEKGIYFTTALKCHKKDYLVSAQTLKNCSVLLQKEIEQFKNIRAVMLMGDFAIKSINYIWKDKRKESIIPKGSTYKIRESIFESNGIRFFPSYTQTGESFNIEKIKRKMISEDIRKAMEFVNSQG